MCSLNVSNTLNRYDSCYSKGLMWFVNCDSKLLYIFVRMEP